MLRKSGQVGRRERAGQDMANSIRFAQEGDKFSIIYEQECLELDGESLVTLIFGVHDEAEKEIMSRMEGRPRYCGLCFRFHLPGPG